MESFELKRAEIEKEVEYLLHVDYEAAFPMSMYRELTPLRESLVNMIIAHIGSTAEKTRRETTYAIANRLKDEVTHIIYDQKEKANE